MNLLCLEPVINAGELTAFTTFYNNSSSYLHQIIHANLESSKHYFNSRKNSYICYDAFKTLRVVQSKIPFLWDVKILYELLGYKSDNLIVLGREVFGYGRMERYVDFSNQVSGHINSYKQAKIDIRAYETIQLLPEDLINDLYLERASIIKDLFLNLKEEDKEFYKEFYSSVEALHTISSDPINIDLDSIANSDVYQAANVRKNTDNGHVYLKFNAA